MSKINTKNRVLTHDEQIACNMIKHHRAGEKYIQRKRISVDNDEMYENGRKISVRLIISVYTRSNNAVLAHSLGYMTNDIYPTKNRGKMKCGDKKSLDALKVTRENWRTASNKYRHGKH